MKKGWIQLHRQLLDWRWYTNITVKTLFIHFLLQACRKKVEWQGITLLPGQLVTSYSTLSEQTGLTVQQIRTAINKLQSTGEIKHDSTNKYTIITVCNWSVYQADRRKKATKKQTNNKPTTTYNNINAYSINNKNIDMNVYGHHYNVYLTKDEYTRLSSEVINREQYINALSDYIASTGKNYKSHYATIIQWRRKANRLIDQRDTDVVENKMHSVPKFRTGEGK
ncbi:MAG: hypothetical protein IKY30_04895 [Oscillospiraceae bacterium]|nr:hypothetical protein [Oscillospiraceae bacterium]